VIHGTGPSSYGRGAPVWPWVLVAICLICLIMKLAFLFLGPANSEAWLHFWGFVPSQVSAWLVESPRLWLNPELTGLLTSLFIHADWLHLLGNLAYLWVFGITVERAVGHVRFGLLFLVLGLLANLFVVWQLSDITVPVIGASGGVSAIIGVYLGLFPQRRMGLWIPLGLYLQFARVPALLVIGSWFTLQLLYSLFGPISSAVVWWSHVAGFAAGLTAALLLRLFSGKVNYALRED
jgi:membrane associated rhomboid family serine protease